MLLIAGGSSVPGDVQHLSVEVFLPSLRSSPSGRPLLTHAARPRPSRPRFAVQNGRVLLKTFVLTKLDCRAGPSFPVRAARFATGVSPSAGNISPYLAGVQAPANRCVRRPAESCTGILKIYSCSASSAPRPPSPPAFDASN